MQKLTGSVGRGGKNFAVDVRVVQQLLNQHKIVGQNIPLKVDGIAGLKTVTRIECFQKSIVKMMLPDGRIDPNGKSWMVLIKSPNSLILAPKVTYSPNIPVSKQIVSKYAISIIQHALCNSGMSQAVITSTIRTPEEQAQIMYRGAKKNLTDQFRLYGSARDEVLRVYNANKTRPESETIGLMKQKICELLKQGRRTSKHVVTESQYRHLNIIDIGLNSTRAASGSTFNFGKFTIALGDLLSKGYISKLIDETKKSNSCWHIEVTPNIKPMPQN